MIQVKQNTTRIMVIYILLLVIVASILFIANTLNQISSTFKQEIKTMNRKIDDNIYNFSPKEIQDIEEVSAIPIELTRAIISIESGGRVNAFNKKEGAVGLMQLRPVVYKNLCGMTQAQAFEPTRNVACGTLYIKGLLHKFSGQLNKALIYYNSGNAMIDNGYVKKVKFQTNKKKGVRNGKH